MATSYRSLSSNSRFLRGTAFDSGESVLTSDDRASAELQAAVEIESGLGQTFTAAPNAPPIIALIADLLGSAVILEFVALANNLGKDGEGAKKPEWLRKKAAQIIADLRAHKIGVAAADGSYPFPNYPAPSILPTVGLGAAKNISIDAGLQWGQMAQGRITDDEKAELDPTRGRNAMDAEAALAGAYGL